MNSNFVNRKDRIVASAIEIISEAGLESLTTKSLAMKENMSESLLYRYFGGIDEVLVEVVDTFTKFDNSMIATIEAKNISHFDKVVSFLKTLGTYYSGYSEMSSIVLNYEGLLHNVNTRDVITDCILKRTAFIKKELQAAIDEGEIIDTFTPEELCNILMGASTRDLLNRRITNETRKHEVVAATTLEKIEALLKVQK